MNVQRIPFAVVVLALTVGCTWAATQASGFAVIPENEASQILGGLGWQCNTLQWEYDDENLCHNYGTEEDCTYWVLFYDTWQCGVADSGQCDDSLIVIGFAWGACAWDPEFEYCWYDGPGYEVPVYGCVR